MKVVGVYDPYIHILGGAERYVFSIVQCIRDVEKIILFADHPELLVAAEKKFGLALPQIEVVTWPLDRSNRNRILRSLDLFFYVTDGSLFWSPAKKNVLIIQSPIHIPKRTLTNTIKLNSWHKIICYSSFVKSFIEKRLGKKPDTLFVPIDVPKKLFTHKKNTILSIGRFFPHLHNKKQKEMVAAFRKLITSGLPDVELYLVGSIDPGGESYFQEVSEMAEGLPLKIFTSASYGELQELLAESKIYWHAAGWGEDLELFPEKAEHFGVSTVEAMSYGLVPVVFDGGGQREIVTNGSDGFTYRSEDELLKYTRELLQNNDLCQRFAQKAYESSKKYSLSAFSDKLNEIIS